MLLHQRILWALLFQAVGVGISAQASDMARPDDADKATEINIATLIVNVDEINSAMQKFSASVFFRARWHDPRLAHDGDGPISRPLGDIWNPRLKILNGRNVSPTLPKTVEITPDGEVIYRQLGWGDFTQNMQLHEFPFDQHTFEIVVVAVGYTDADVVLVPDASVTSGLAENFSESSWEILGWNSESRPYSAFAGGPTAAGFVVSFEARRHTSYFVQRMLIPLIVIVMASWIVFWMAPKEERRIGVAMTAMLTIMAYRFMVAGLLPKITYMTRLDMFVLISTLLVFATLIEAVSCTVLIRRQQITAARKLDKFSRVAFPVSFSVALAYLFLA